LLLMFEIHDDRLVTTPPTFSELARLSKLGRRSGDLEDGGVASRAGDGADGNAVVVSRAGCEIAAGVTWPGQELFLCASDRFDCVMCCSLFTCDDDLLARLTIFDADVDRDRVARTTCQYMVVSINERVTESIWTYVEGGPRRTFQNDLTHLGISAGWVAPSSSEHREYPPSMISTSHDHTDGFGQNI
jgi:hypothetical protein